MILLSVPFLEGSRPNKSLYNYVKDDLHKASILASGLHQAIFLSCMDEWRCPSENRIGLININFMLPIIAGS